MIEMSSVHGLPIFISRTEIDSEKRRLGLIWAEQTGDTPAVQQEKEVFMSEGRQSFIEFQSLLNAFKWTAYIISGATVAYPKSSAARGIRAVSIGLQRLLVIFVTAAFAPVLTTSAIAVT